MKDEDRLRDDPQLRRLAGWISALPGAEPPPDLTARIMGALPVGKIPRRRRWLRWLRRPMTLSPLQLAPAGLAILLVAAVAVLQLRTGLDAPRDAESVPARGAAGVPVVLELFLPEARQVAVIGAFNGWLPDGFAMQRDPATGLWRLPLNLPQGRYAYAFLVDGRHVTPDPGAVLRQADGFGRENSILVVDGNHEHANRT